MSVTTTSWNIEGRLSIYSTRRGSPSKILDEVRRLDSDIISFPEAYDATKGVGRLVDKRVRKLGYDHVYDVDYGDRGPVRETSAVDHPYLRIMSKLAFLSVEDIRLGDLRNAISATFQDPATGKPFRIIAVHLDDRNEELRLRQVDDLVNIINASDMPTIVQGDMNAMDGDTMKARIMRSPIMRTLAQAVPIPSVNDVLVRATDMASGQVYARLVGETNLRDVDSQHRPTATPRMRGLEFFPSIRLIDIDHMLVSPEVVVESYSVGTRDAGSDHRPITATLSIK